MSTSPPNALPSDGSSPNFAVNISVETLEQLFHLRQDEAANTLGVSLTSFKLACRKLGLDRWPYLRKAQQGSGSETPGSSSTGVGDAHDAEAVQATFDMLVLEEVKEERGDSSTPALLLEGNFAIGQHGEDTHKPWEPNGEQMWSLESDWLQEYMEASEEEEELAGQDVENGCRRMK
ncbi:hypothetical protein GUITHDRAFT_116875 [Guillardia theta CCMP2712]|uniref:RWP-RK domain-containing protein n=1 Tax=Guillardia theta (strain CCMP2712) TaxID=905079 RepID=L1IMH8_GUITC|nr:hypothetical protein GUITHDRAFT_116875 [Guillardia theta CCMP2712]EKX37010.1 hypothetical protein GUITHDRAFT_116875 [Guillardia theta CCMP2712]|eukprot:XP_005823990.1 hypothetical protein GUITHDRAFT_116875 [Guillardia theta CCMP2712]